MSRSGHELPPNEAAFLKAASAGDLCTIRELLRRGVPVDIRNEGNGPCWDQTALMYAAGAGHVEVARFLLEEGASVNARDKGAEGAGGKQPLHYAAESKTPAMVELLLVADADTDALDKAGDPPINLAIRAGDLPVVRLLLAGGAKVNPDTAGPRKPTPPLMAAIASNQLALATLLLQSGANVNAVDSSGQTPLIQAAQAPEQIGVALSQELLAAGAEVDHLDKWGHTAFYCAVLQWHLKTAEAIARGGADLSRNYSTLNGTLLEAAVERIGDSESELSDPNAPQWARGGAEEDLKQWRRVLDLLRRLGAAR